MSETLTQRMLGRFEVFVRWVSEVKRTSSGQSIRVRAVIGKQWSTIQIPLELAPASLKKGDFIIVSGSVTALKDGEGASNYLFVEKFHRHITAEEVANGVPKQSTTVQHPQKAESAGPSPAQASSQPTDRPRRTGGYQSNRKAQPVGDQKPVQASNYKAPTAESTRRGGYGSNQTTRPAQSASQVPTEKPNEGRKIIQGGYAANRRRSQSY